MKRKEIFATLAMVLTISIAVAQEKVDYEREGNQTKVTYYYENSDQARETGYFVNGVTHGTWVQYNRDGEVRMKAHYDQGKKVGTWFVWADEGKSLYELAYEDNYLKRSHKWSLAKKDLLADN